MKLAPVAPVVLLLAAACSGNDDSPPTAKHQGPPGNVMTVPGDAGVALPPGVDPSTVHLDDYDGTVRRVSPQPLPGRERRAIDVTLRSSPPGALASVDGTPVGNTPAFWSGFADGREHQFVFTLPRHAVARYRFVPVSSGVLHARLEPIAEERGDAGVAMPPPEVVPQPPTPVTPQPSPPVVVPQPQTPVTSPPPAVLAPTADAAVVTPGSNGSASAATASGSGRVGPQP